MALPKLRDVVGLSDLASNVYQHLKPQEYIGKLAPSLGMIIQKDLNIADVKVSDEFLDPVTFLSTTYFREPLVDALRAVNTSLQKVSDAVPVIPLTHAMGLGKTHFLTLLYHLYTKAPLMWNNIENVLPEETKIIIERSNYKIDISRKTFVISMDLKGIPSDALPYETLFDIMQRVFSKYKKENLASQVPRNKLDDFEGLLKKLGRYEPVNAAKEFVKALSGLAIDVPVLIIVDEVYAAVFEAFAGASKDYVDSVRKVLMFLAVLVDELRGRFPAVFVYASAMQDVLMWRREVANLPIGSEREYEKELLKVAVNYFEERTSRVMPISVREVNEEEALEIIKKRIVRPKVPVNEVLSEDQLKAIQKALSEIVGEAEATRFVNELRRTYPFSPAYKELVKKLIVPTYSSDFAPGKLQHLRDLIKISSSVLGRALSVDDETYLISMAQIEHDDIKHLLDEGYANEWWRNVLSWRTFLEYVKADTKDDDLVKMVKGAISSIYVKSVTNNAWDLMSMMIKSQDALSPEDLNRRALLQVKLILSLVGIVDVEKLLKKYPEVLGRLNLAPYIHSVERDESKYYYASLFENPHQLLNTIRESELRKLKDESGDLKIREAVEYVGEKLKEYSLVSKFKDAQKQGRVPLNVDIVGIEEFEGDAVRFIERLNNSDVFTVLVVSPISVADRLLVKGARFEDVLESIRSYIDRNKNKIKGLNMFAVVVPNIDRETLGRLVNSLAEISASNQVVEMLKSDKGLREFVESATERHKSLLDLIRRPEEDFKSIVMEIIKRFRERLEDYAQRLNQSAVQNFTSSFVGLFSKVISYNPSSHKIEVYDLKISFDKQPSELSYVLASLPIWIGHSVKGKLGVADAVGIRTKLIEWIKRIVQTDAVREVLRNEGEHKFSISTIEEGLIRGWPDVPIKPQSVSAIKSAIASLGGVIDTGDEEFKLIEVVATENDLVIRPKREVVPPPPPPRGGVLGFEVVRVDDVNIVLANAIRNNELARRIKSVSMEVKVGSDAEISIKGSLDKISEFVEPLRNYLNRRRNDIIHCKLTVRLTENVEESKVQELIGKIGLSSNKIEFLRGDKGDHP